ncbi:unnamed protein product [Mytilus coruscus]|uniref:Reverse transcriptase domain-containing protein n=1 Tax=Mytilus coruscus TaxID=42192 RepID=A0A6J8B886_MYTCO|nr:unnamed protein product [Mytilus coruscus]
MGPVQSPQRKGRVPQYSRNQLVELQQKFNELEAFGVFKRPEDIGVEYVNPSFLVKKPNGSFRLVTAFAAFYQIPLSSDSMKYWGVVTPFKSVRVYVRFPMGMSGSETALEELMCRVLGDLVEEGVVAKIADDLYCGRNTQLELLQNWTRVLQALQKKSLNLSAS